MTKRNNVASRNIMIALANMMLMLSILLLESQTPLGFAHGFLYLIVVLLAAMSGQVMMVLLSTSLSLPLIFLGMMLSAAEGGNDAAFIWGNRLLAAFTVLMVGAVCLYLIQQSRRKDKTNVRLNQLNKKTTAKLKLLGMAGKPGLFGGWSLSVSNNRVTWSDEVADIMHLPRNYSPPLEQVIHFFTAEARPAVSRFIHNCIQYNQPFDDEFPVSTPNKDLKWVRLIGQPRLDKHGKLEAITGSVQDISNYADAIEGIAKSQLRFQQMADALPVNIYSTTPEGRVEFINRRAVGITGLKFSQRLHEDWMNALHPEDRNRVYAQWKKAVNNSDGDFHCEYRLRHPNGCFDWYLANAQPVVNRQGRVQQWVGSVVNIGQQKAVQQELRTLATRLENSLNLLPLPFLTVKADLTLSYLNRQAENWFSVRREDYQGQSLLTLLPRAFELAKEQDLYYHLREGQTYQLPEPHPVGEHLSNVIMLRTQDQLSIFLNDHIQQHRQSTATVISQKNDQNCAEMASSAKPEQHRLKILLVEDDPLVREYALMQLSSAGFDIVAAENGNDAIMALSRHADINLLFSDVVMPGGINGFELADIALKQQPELKVLLTSGYNEYAEVESIDRMSKFPMLKKPYRRDTLINTIRTVCDENE